MQTRDGTVVSQMDRWTMCKRKGMVAIVSLMGNMQTRRDRHGVTGGWASCKERENGGITDGQRANEREQWCHGWVTCNKRGWWLWCHRWAMCK